MNITEFAHLAQGDDWTLAFEAAAEKGGEIRVPAGRYMTGSIKLNSNTTLNLENGAYICFIQDKNRFPVIPLQYDDTNTTTHRACIYAENAHDIRITGDGVIDGGGAYWWEQFRSKALEHCRPNLICFNRCERVTIEYVTLMNSPYWTVHPLRCNKVTARSLNIKNPSDSPNTDGINPDSCQDVLITGCTIDVGDDCITIKSGAENVPDLQPSRRVIISDCHLLHGHGGIVLGSEMSGGISDVSVTNCVFYGTDRGVRLKTRRGRGGSVSGIRLTGLMMIKVMCPFVFNMFYFCGSGGKCEKVWDKNPRAIDEGTPSLRDVSISSVTCRECGACAGYFYGLPEMPVKNISIRDVIIDMDKDAQPDTPAMMTDCPRFRNHGFFLRNATGVEISGLTIDGVDGEVFDIDGSVKLN